MFPPTLLSCCTASCVQQNRAQLRFLYLLSSGAPAAQRATKRSTLTIGTEPYACIKIGNRATFFFPQRRRRQGTTRRPYANLNTHDASEKKHRACSENDWKEPSQQAAHFKTCFWSPYRWRNALNRRSNHQVSTVLVFSKGDSSTPEYQQQRSHVPEPPECLQQKQKAEEG